MKPSIDYWKEEIKIHGWRNVKIVETLLGEADDIRRKQIAIARVKVLKKIWIIRNRIREMPRLKAYSMIVNPVLRYKCAPERLTGND